MSGDALVSGGDESPPRPVRRGRPPRSAMETQQTALDVLGRAPEVNYLAREFASTGLPYRDPDSRRDTPLPAWSRRNGPYSLIIRPGYVTGPDGEPTSIGFPFGSIPRLLLAWLTTEAVRTQSPEITLGSSLTDFMSELNLSPSGGQFGTIGRIQKQMHRLFGATFVYDDATLNKSEGVRSATIPVTRSYELFWGREGAPRPRSDQLTLPSRVLLNDDFYQQITEHAVPLNLHILKALSSSPMQLDLYSWLTYRMYNIDDTVWVSWQSLMEQFGSNKKDDRRKLYAFKRDMERNLKVVKDFYPQANVSIVDTGLRLQRSPTSVPSRLVKFPHVIAGANEGRSGSSASRRGIGSSRSQIVSGEVASGPSLAPDRPRTVRAKAASRTPRPRAQPSTPQPEELPGFTPAENRRK
jgi:hypothetical protein